MSVSVEITRRVYNDDSGEFVQIGPDGDGLGICHIHFEDGDLTHDFYITKEHARAVGEQLIKLADDMQDQP